MSLVAYDYGSSDEESDNEPETQKGTTKMQTEAQTAVQAVAESDAAPHISDDEEDECAYVQADLPLEDIPGILSEMKVSYDLSMATELTKLPAPSTTSAAEIEEVDDEFLRIKAKPIDVPTAPPLTSSKKTVQITVPSMKEFADVDEELAKRKRAAGAPNRTKGCGLFDMLPTPKSEQTFLKTNPCTPNATNKAPIAKPAFIPDSVRYRRPAHNTEFIDGVSGCKPAKKQLNAKSAENVQPEECEPSDDEATDFFSLNSARAPLPEVSANEIQALVAKRAAEIAGNQQRYLNETQANDEESSFAACGPLNEAQQAAAAKRARELALDDDAITALAGANAKRKRKEQEAIQIIDISSADVQPSHEEWLRSTLSNATGYQPTGGFKNEELVPGTRRKHQITYLAHQAKTNEAELQAMWATNRSNRRATQNKYGF